jgi:hypothetical protein
MGKTNWNRPAYLRQGRISESIHGDRAPPIPGSPARLDRPSKAELRAEADRAFRSFVDGTKREAAGHVPLRSTGRAQSAGEADHPVAHRVADVEQSPGSSARSPAGRAESAGRGNDDGGTASSDLSEDDR